MKKKRIAIVSGGFSEERVISMKSCDFIETWLDSAKYEARVVLIDRNRWYDRDTGIDVDKSDFSIPVEGEKLTFDGVYLIIHGPPVEDGQIQGYFNLLDIPHTTCHTFTSALCFNKQATKAYLKPFDIPIGKSIFLTHGALPTTADMEKLGFPVFVKPNCHGSSFGISKASNESELLDSCEKAYQYDREILVEEFLEGREFSCGVVRHRGKPIPLPVTEIIPKTEFFDFAAKYEKMSEEITPADLPKEISDECREISGRIYDLLNCRGMVRVDFILHREKLKVLEVNTVPGLSPESIIPAQAKAHGWSFSEFLDVVVEETVLNREENP